MTDSMPTMPSNAPLATTDADQLEAEAARLIRDRAETVLNAVAEGVFLLDAAGRTVFVNEAGARMFGYSAREMLGRSQHEMVHHHYADGTDFPLEECPIYASVTDGSASAGIPSGERMAVRCPWTTRRSPFASSAGSSGRW